MYYGSNAARDIRKDLEDNTNAARLTRNAKNRAGSWRIDAVTLAAVGFSGVVVSLRSCCGMCWQRCANFSGIPSKVMFSLDSQTTMNVSGTHDGRFNYMAFYQRLVRCLENDVSKRQQTELLEWYNRCV